MKVDTKIPNLNVSTTPLPQEGMQGMSSDAVRSGGAVQENGAEVVLDAALQRVIQEQKKEKEKNNSVSQDNERQLEIYKYRAIFAVDDDKNVVVRLVDKKGKTVRQYPPEEYLNMQKHFRESVVNLFSIEV